HCGDYMKALGSGKDFGLGVRFTYEIQDSPNGIAEAFLLADNFLDDGDNVALILGDNIFEDNFNEAITSFEKGGRVFAKEVSDPERFGVVKFDDNNKATQIVEKPKEFLSNHAVTGLYIYDGRVRDAVRSLKPSDRGELEITDLNNWYLEKGELDVKMVNGEWIDAGTFDSLYRATELAYKKAKK